MNPDIVINNGLALTMRPGQRPIFDAQIAITDGRIADIRGPQDDVIPSHWPTQTIDAKDCIVMPGLINAHVHAPMTLFRGLADDLPLKIWLFDKIFPAESRFLSPRTVYWGALLGCLEMIRSGTTCFANGYFFEDETARAVHESGLRALIAQGVIDLPAPGVENPQDNLSVARSFIGRWLDFSDLIRPGIFCHSPLTCTKETLQNAWQMSQEFHLPLQIHLSETAEEVRESVKRFGKRPVFYLDQLGLLNKGLIAAHGVHLNDEEISLLTRHNVRLVHVPESNMKLCSGVARIPEMVKQGLLVGLGTDGSSSNNNLDMFQEMDTAVKLGKAFAPDSIRPQAITALQMATCWGAAVMGLEEHIGTLEIGKKADIIILDLKKPHMSPLYDPISAIVYSAQGSDVRDVIVNGRVIMRDRKCLTLDSAKIMSEIRGICKTIDV